RYRSIRASPAGIHPADARQPAARLGTTRPEPRPKQSRSASSHARELRAVVVGRVAIDRVDVIEVALLGRIFDDHGGSLDTVVRQPAVPGRAAPGEIRLREVRLDFRHLGFRGAFIKNTD